MVCEMIYGHIALLFLSYYFILLFYFILTIVRVIVKDNVQNGPGQAINDDSTALLELAVVEAVKRCDVRKKKKKKKQQAERESLTALDQSSIITHDHLRKKEKKQ